MGAPHLLTDQQRAQLVLGVLRRLQAQEFQLGLDQAALNAEPQAPIPDAPLGPNGEVPTFASRLRDIRDAQNRVWHYDEAARRVLEGADGE